MVSLHTFTSLPFYEEVSQKGGQKETHGRFVSLNLELLSMRQMQPESACVPWPTYIYIYIYVVPSHGLPVRILLSVDHWRLRTSEERPWDHQKPTWWHLSLGNLATCVASGAFRPPSAEEQKAMQLGSFIRASGADGGSLSCLARQGWAKRTGTRTSAVTWRGRWLPRLGCISPGK